MTAAGRTGWETATDDVLGASFDHFARVQAEHLASTWITTHRLWELKRLRREIRRRALLRREAPRG